MNNNWDFEDINKGEEVVKKKQKFNLETELEEDIIGVCPACKNESYFKFIGRQEFGNNMTNLYNCLYCHTTRAQESLWRYNNNALIFVSSKIYELIKKNIKNEK